MPAELEVIVCVSLDAGNVHFELFGDRTVIEAVAPITGIFAPCTEQARGLGNLFIACEGVAFEGTVVLVVEGVTARTARLLGDFLCVAGRFEVAVFLAASALCGFVLVLVLIPILVLVLVLIVIFLLPILVVVIVVILSFIIAVVIIIIIPIIIVVFTSPVIVIPSPVVVIPSSVVVIPSTACPCHIYETCFGYAPMCGRRNEDFVSQSSRDLL